MRAGRHGAPAHGTGGLGLDVLKTAELAVVDQAAIGHQFAVDDRAEPVRNTGGVHLGHALHCTAPEDAVAVGSERRVTGSDLGFDGKIEFGW